MKYVSTRNSLFFKLMVSYIVLVFIVIGMMYPIYVNMLNIFKEQAIRDSQSVLQNGLDNLDTALEGIDQTIYNLYTNPDIKKLSTIKGNIESRDVIVVISAQKYLNAVFTPYSIIQDAFMLFKYNDSVVSMHQYYDSKEKFYNARLNFKDQNAEQWSSQLLKQSYNRKLFNEEEIVNKEPGNKNIIAYVTSVPVNSINNFDSVVTVMIGRDRLLKLLLPEEVETNGWLYIQDFKGNMLMKWNYNGPTLGLKESGFTEMELGKQKTTVIYQSSKRNQIQVVVGIPQKVFTTKINRVRWLLYMFFGLAILGGILASGYLSYKNSRPLQKLLSNIEAIGLRVMGGKNEFDGLESVINQLYESREQLDSEVLSQKNIAKAGVIERLLRNGIYTSSDLCVAMKYLPELPSIYRLAVLQYEFYNTVPSESEKTENEGDLIRVVLMNFLKEEFTNELMIHPTGKNHLAILLPCSEDSKIEREEIELKIKRIQRKTWESFEKNIICGISSVCSGTVHLGKAFLEAQKALRYVVPNQEGIVIWEKQDSIDQGIRFDFYESQKLFQLLLAGEKDTMLTLMNETISKNKEIIRADNKMSQQLFYMLRGVIISARKELQNIKSNIPITEYSEDILPERLFDSLVKSCRSICEEVDRLKRSHNRSLKDAILSYICTHYSDADICAESIAGVFNVSEKYPYILIKEETGKSFGDYLEGIRMGNAIRLMKETSLPISQIASDVGFLSQNSFYKAFKRVFGVSPSAWRSSFMVTPQ